MPVRCCIHQPEHLSYPGFWCKLSASDVWVVLDTAQYLKNHYHNRNKIDGPAGGWQWLTVPVIVPGHKSSINKVVIADEFNASKLIATITHRYRSAPSFHRIHPLLNEAYQRASKHRNLSELNIELTENIARYLGIHRTIIRASTLPAKEPPISKSDRLVQICRDISADTYVCGAGSEKYMDSEPFRKAGIKIEQVSYTPKPYPRHHQCQPNLSIIDLLMYSPDSNTAVTYLKSSLSTRTNPELCLKE